MPAVFTPLLAEGRRGQLDLGEHGSSPCRITGFAGPTVVLDIGNAALDLSTMPAGLTAYLLLDDGGHMQALRAELQPSQAPGTAVLRLTDRFSGQRRLFSRAPLSLRAQVSSPGASPWDTFTRDVSAGGVALDRRPAWDGSPRLEIVLALEDGSSVEAEADVLRASPDRLGLGFTRIAPADRARLAELALAFHRAS